MFVRKHTVTMQRRTSTPKPGEASKRTSAQKAGVQIPNLSISQRVMRSPSDARASTPMCMSPGADPLLTPTSTALMSPLPSPIMTPGGTSARSATRLSFSARDTPEGQTTARSRTSITKGTPVVLDTGQLEDKAQTKPTLTKSKNQESRQSLTSLNPKSPIVAPPVESTTPPQRQPDKFHGAWLPQVEKARESVTKLAELLEQTEALVLRAVSAPSLTMLRGDSKTASLGSHAPLKNPELASFADRLLQALEPNISSMAEAAVRRALCRVDSERQLALAGDAARSAVPPCVGAVPFSARGSPPPRPSVRGPPLSARQDSSRGLLKDKLMAGLRDGATTRRRSWLESSVELESNGSLELAVDKKMAQVKEQKVFLPNNVQLKLGCAHADGLAGEEVAGMKVNACDTCGARFGAAGVRLDTARQASLTPGRQSKKTCDHGDGFREDDVAGVKVNVCDACGARFGHNGVRLKTPRQASPFRNVQLKKNCDHGDGFREEDVAGVKVNVCDACGARSGPNGVRLKTARQASPNRNMALKKKCDHGDGFREEEVAGVKVNVCDACGGRFGTDGVRLESTTQADGSVRQPVYS
eukprot:TRINITY_DN3070_c0_g1_i4.p1 TRINITY_DN3070_c0_g1~~TRINITY_DN3070_c0_g1_i4.p1  ORF type:complete len:586 (+),score=81.24 TRINITY_DN3070_c0_g1_i4:194-1951(+)